MFIGQLIGLGLIGVALLLIAAIRPRSSSLSQFELQRRQKNGDHDAVVELRRNQMFDDIMSLLRVKSGLFLVLFTTLSIATFGWLYGLGLAVLVALSYGALARLSVVNQPANRLYQRYESTVLRVVEKWHVVVRLLRTVQPVGGNPVISSKAELLHYVERSHGVLSPDERKLIEHGLGFADSFVQDIMTPRQAIATVAVKEHLGPLVLDDLHKTGHSRFPVIDKDINHVVGLLDIEDLLTIDAKRKSSSVKNVMEPKVFYIKQDQNLQHALSALVHTKHHIFIVVNELQETVGLLTLGDTIGALLGRKIIDEFDSHEDLRVVANRTSRTSSKT